MWVVITNRAVLPNADGSGFVLAGADSSFILIVVSLASLVILLVLITVIIVCICRKRNKVSTRSITVMSNCMLRIESLSLFVFRRC